MADTTSTKGYEKIPTMEAPEEGVDHPVENHENDIEKGALASKEYGTFDIRRGWGAVSARNDNGNGLKEIFLSLAASCLVVVTFFVCSFFVVSVILG